MEERPYLESHMERGGEGISIIHCGERLQDWNKCKNFGPTLFMPEGGVSYSKTRNDCIFFNAAQQF